MRASLTFAHLLYILLQSSESNTQPGTCTDTVRASKGRITATDDLCSRKTYVFPQDFLTEGQIAEFRFSCDHRWIFPRLDNFLMLPKGKSICKVHGIQEGCFTYARTTSAAKCQFSSANKSCANVAISNREPMNVTFVQWSYITFSIHYKVINCAEPCSSETEEFATCPSLCPDTCAQRSVSCRRRCAPAGCVCKGGYVRHNGACIPNNKCPRESKPQPTVPGTTEEIKTTLPMISSDLTIKIAIPLAAVGCFILLVCVGCGFCHIRNRTKRRGRSANPETNGNTISPYAEVSMTSTTYEAYVNGDSTKSKKGISATELASNVSKETKISPVQVGCENDYDNSYYERCETDQGRSQLGTQQNDDSGYLEIDYKR